MKLHKVKFHNLHLKLDLLNCCWRRCHSLWLWSCNRYFYIWV